MVVTDLKTEPSSRTGKRQHPLSTIVKDEGLYDVRTPALPLTEKATLNDLRLRMNVMELNQNILMRELAVMQERGTPFDGVVVPSNVLKQAPSNVTPMRKTGPTHVIKTEQSKAAQAPTPVSSAMVVGNTALALPAPSETVSKSQPQPTLTKVSDVEPHHIKPPYTELTAQFDRGAANDDVLPEETTREMKIYTDEDPQLIADIGFHYGMDVVECHDILYREFARRERHAYETHGKPRDDVKLERLLKQQGYVIRPRGVSHHAYHKSEDTTFSGYFHEMAALEPILRLRSKQTEARDSVRRKIFGAMGYRTTALVPKGEQNFRDRKLERLKATMRKPQGTFKANDKTATTLKGVGDPSVTTASQYRAISSFVNEVGDRFRRTKLAKAFGLGPVLRSAKQREQFESEYEGSELEFSQKYPLLYRERSRTKVQTFNTLRAADRNTWFRPHGTLPTQPKARFDTISKELVNRGIYTTEQVESMVDFYGRKFDWSDDLITLVTPTK